MYDFYTGRIMASVNYGLKSGSEIIEMVIRCASTDRTLTLEDYNSIINLANTAHRMLMEANYNEGWN